MRSRGVNVNFFAKVVGPGWKLLLLLFLVTEVGTDFALGTFHPTEAF